MTRRCARWFPHSGRSLVTHTISLCQSLFHSAGTECGRQLWSTEKLRLALEMRLSVRVQKAYHCQKTLCSSHTHTNTKNKDSVHLTKIKNNESVHLLTEPICIFFWVTSCHYYLQQLLFLVRQARYVGGCLFDCSVTSGLVNFIKELVSVWVLTITSISMETQNRELG